MNRVLIAEDEPRIASFLTKGLRAAGYTATVVTNGVDVAAGARSGDFDLLILDLGLPGQDGLAALAQIRAHGGEAAGDRADRPRRRPGPGYRP